jgi:hypothetical protein
MSDATPPARKRTRKAAAPDPGVEPDAHAAFEAAEAAAVREARVEAGGSSTATPRTVRLPTPTPALRIERGGIDEVTAGSVEVRMGGIGSLDAEEVFVQWGGVGAARAEKVGVEFGSVGAALAGELNVTQGFVNSVVARTATIEQGIARTVIAQRVTFARPSAVLVLIAAKVEGEVRPLLDWRGALAAGAAFGLVSAVAKVLRARR